MMRRLARAAAIPLFMVAGAVSAHPKLLSSSPAANATGAAPAAVDLRFSERLIEKLSSADLTMTAMPGMKMTAPSKVPAKASLGSDGKSLKIVPAKPLTPGTYKLSYRVTSVDTHRVNGGFDFRVK